MSVEAAGERKTQVWVAYSIAFAVFMCTLDNYIVNISLPTISRAFNADITAVSRIVIVYLLVLTSTIPFFGKLGDRVGLLKVFIAGYVVFITGSFLCGISSSIGMLIVSRCIQGIGGSALYTIPSAIIMEYLPQKMRGEAFGIVTTAAAVGFSVGSPLGGIITSFCGWNWIFLINVPVGIVALAIVIRFFPRHDDREKNEGPFDVTGLFLSFSGLLMLMFSLNMGRELGWTSPAIIGSLGGSLALLALFVVWERKCSNPLLDTGIFRSRNFAFANLSNFFVFMASSGTNLILPFYLINGHTLKGEQAGCVLLCFSLVNMCVGPLAGRASDRISPRILSCIGTLLTVFACIVLSVTLNLHSLWPAILFLVLTGISIGIFLSPNNNQIMSAAPIDRHGMSSGILRTVTNLGSVIGVGLLGTVYSLSIPGTGGNGAISQEAVIAGVHSAIIVAMLLYSAAFICALLTRDR
jgi:EmrB/QacA subfamily drug resistance transporter